MADKNLDEYKTLKFYKNNSKPRKNGFAKFTEDGSHYFALYKDGDIALISQAYVSEAGRDNGIESVRKNAKIKTRYHFDSRSGGKRGFSLKAGNGQEVAVSPNYASKAKAEYAAGRLNGSVKKAADAPTPKKPIAKKSTAKKSTTDGRIENYHPLAFYKSHANKSVKDGFDSFTHKGAHYFTYKRAGKIILISESYTSRAGRDNGIASVRKNLPLKTRYQHHVHKNGKHYFDLNAANGHEIATSIWYGSAAAAATGAAGLFGTRKRPVAKGKGKAAANAASAAAKTVAPKPKSTSKPNPKPKPKTKAKPKAAPTVTAAASAGLTAPAMAKAAKPVPPRDKDDDYLKCEDYHGHEVTDAKNNIALFSHENNKEYFVVYDDDGDVLIRSEGFDSISKRSSELAAVLRLKNDVKNFTRIEKNGYFMDILKDENGREVGRSCLRKIVPPVAAAPAAAAVPPAAVTGGTGWGWLKWLLPLFLLSLLGFFGLKSCGGDKANNEAAATQAEKAAAVTLTAAKAD